MSGVVRSVIWSVFLLVMMPVILWLMIAAIADASDYLALMRSGLLLLGLGLGIGWGFLRNSPKLVLLGLALAFLGYLSFFWVSGTAFGWPDYDSHIYNTLPWEIRFGLDRQIVPGFTVGQFAALVLILANVVMVQRRLPIARVALNNLLISAAIIIATTALGAH